MTRTRYILVGLLTILSLGCPARSIFPLFEEKDLVFNPTLIGTWVNARQETMTFERAGETRAYNVTLRDPKGDTARYRVEWGQIGKIWFLDSYPMLREEGAGHILPVHMFHKVWVRGDTLELASLEGDWLGAMADSNKLTIPYVRREGEVILTASTKELQTFLFGCAEHPKAFGKPGQYVRSK